MNDTPHELRMALYFAKDDPARLKEIITDLIHRIEEDEFNEADRVREEFDLEIEGLNTAHREDLQKEEEKTALVERNRDLWRERAEERGYEVPETPFNIHNFRYQFETPWANGHCCTLCHKIEGEDWLDDRIDLTIQEAEEIKSRIEEVCGDEELIARILGEYWEKLPKERWIRFDRAPAKKGKRK